MKNYYKQTNRFQRTKNDVLNIQIIHRLIA